MSGFDLQGGIKATSGSRRLDDRPDFPPFRRETTERGKPLGRNGGKSGIILAYKNEDWRRWLDWGSMPLRDS